MNDKIVFETFTKISQYKIRDMTIESCSCFNGNVMVKKYKVTIEEIREPKEVIAERIQKLWDECDNMHHRGPLKAMAKTIGLEL